MSNPLGDFDLSTVVYGKFNTFRPSTGAPFTLGGTPVLSVYKDNSTTQSTTGVTLTVDFDSLTGLHHFAVDTSADGTFYSSGSFFDIVITTGTVDGVSLVGTTVASFTLRKNSALKPATAGRTLVVDASGLADANMVKAGPSGSGTAQTSKDIGGALPAATAGSAGGLLIAGSNAATTFATLTVTGATTLTGNVACAAGITVTQSTVNGHGISVTGNGTGDGVHIVGGATSGNGIYAEGVGIGAGAWLHGGSDSGTSGLYCDASGDGHGIYSQGSGAGNGMYILSDVLGTGNAVAFSSANGTGDGLDITGEIGLDLNGTGGDHISPSAASQIADYVWDEATAGHTTAGTTGKALTDAGSAGDPWSTALPGAYGAGTAGKILGDNLNATVSSRASQTSVDTIDDFLDTEIAAIKAKTDNLPADPADASDIAASFTSTNALITTVDTVVDAIKAKTDNLTFTVAGQVDANAESMNGTEILGNGSSGDLWRG